MKVKVKSLDRVRLFVTPWTVAYQASQSLGFSRQEYWSGVAIAFSRFHRLSLSWASAAQPFATLEYQVLIFCVCQSLSCVRLFETPQTAACQVFLSVEFSRQEYWSRLPLPSPEALPDPGTKPMSPSLAGRFFTTGPPGKSLNPCFN